MKYALKVATLALCVATSLPLSAGRRRAAVPSTALSIEFVEVAGAGILAAGADAWVDVNTVTGSKGKPARATRQFGIRIVRAGGVSWGMATITARLDSPDHRCRLRIDGQPVGSRPVVVGSRVAVGTMTVHTLEIEVSDTVSEGPLEASIAWEVTSQ